MSPQEAAYPLTGDIPAGSYTLTADGHAVSSPDVELAVIWRRGAKNGAFEAGAPDASAERAVIDGAPGDSRAGDAAATTADAQSHGDRVLAVFRHVYPGTGIDQYQDTVQLPAVASAPGDELVLRMSLAADSPAGAEYIPFGETPSIPTARWVQLAIP